MLKTIQIEQLEQFCEVPSKLLCQTFAEATSVCFNFHQHPSAVTFEISGDLKGKLKLSWQPISKKVMASYDLSEATEMAAVCLSLWIIEQFTSFKVVQRGKIGERVDYFLAKKDAKPPYIFSAYLEVSGLLDKKQGRVNQRLKEKIAQAIKGSYSQQTGFVIVVELGKIIAKTKVI